MFSEAIGIISLRIDIHKWTSVRKPGYDCQTEGGRTIKDDMFSTEQSGGLRSRMPRRSSVKDRAPDRRVQRTRRLLHDALMSCILEKKYELISVQDILDRADIGRSTFYTHFQDKDDLLLSGFENLKGLLHGAQMVKTT